MSKLRIGRQFSNEEVPFVRGFYEYNSKSRLIGSSESLGTITKSNVNVRMQYLVTLTYEDNIVMVDILGRTWNIKMSKKLKWVTVGIVLVFTKKLKVKMYVQGKYMYLKNRKPMPDYFPPFVDNFKKVPKRTCASRVFEIEDRRKEQDRYNNPLISLNIFNKDITIRRPSNITWIIRNFVSKIIAKLGHSYDDDGKVMIDSYGNSQYQFTRLAMFVNNIWIYTLCKDTTTKSLKEVDKLIDADIVMMS